MPTYVAAMTLALRTAAALAAAVSLSGCQKLDDAFGDKVHGYLMAHPEVVREAAVKLAENDRLAALKASTVAIDKYRGQLERDNRDFVANPDGKITVVEFFDYRCGYCKLAAPEVVKLINENPDVRFVFKEFPIFGEVSDTAAKIALTDSAKAKGVELYKALMADRALDDAALDRHLAEVGVNAAAARKDADQPLIARQLLDTHALAVALKIDGTPAFIVGQTMIPGADMSALRAAIASARAGTNPAKTTS
ncbi:MAG: protein-disulfide isomerase [Phenylobacterium sp.]|jgi:protein-disulfide isomerase|nr:protein-disulfide isomerase [Phenylobacterium sp.]MDB5434930.1 protein-disulfide isomerase [Phenylobacterium sp.]MDB5463108.1 protein-disulfide isomerase [Phenylobacterium sp.]